MKVNRNFKAKVKELSLPILAALITILFIAGAIVYRTRTVVTDPELKRSMTYGEITNEDYNTRNRIC